LFEKNKEVIIKKIIELMEDKSSRVCNSIIVIMKKINNNSLCESKVNEMIMSISEKINNKLGNNTWYLRLVKGWKSIVKTKREVKLRYRELKRMGKTRGHKKNEKRDKRKREDEWMKRNWYSNRDGGLSRIKLIKDTSKEQFLFYLAKTYYVD